MALDGNTLFPLQIHIIKHLVFHLSGTQCLGKFDETVSQCTFTVIDMGYDTKISYVLHLVPLFC